jgi:hypothetical protein
LHHRQVMIEKIHQFHKHKFHRIYHDLLYHRYEYRKGYLHVID